MTENDQWQDLIECFSRKGSIQLLLYLKKENREVNFSELVKIPGIGKLAIYNSLQCLANSKLVTEKRVPAHNQRLVKLTSKGIEVTDKILEIKELIEK